MELLNNQVDQATETSIKVAAIFVGAVTFISELRRKLECGGLIYAITLALSATSGPSFPKYNLLVNFGDLDSMSPWSKPF